MKTVQLNFRSFIGKTAALKRQTFASSVLLQIDVRMVVREILLKKKKAKTNQNKNLVRKKWQQFIQ